jgi:predicted TIM-barrel fold metal-dependent hydrolase
MAMLLENYRPRSCLVTQCTRVLYPRYPVIDAHNHLGEDFGGGWINRPVEELIGLLDEAGVRLYVDLDGGWGENILKSHLDKLKGKYPDRFKVFGGVDWEAWKNLGDRFPEWAARRLAAQKEIGAEGLKIWKNFGLSVKDQHGDRIDIDDERLDPIWETAEALKLPVMIHVADPVAFFDPLDESNERWEELIANPEWQFPSPPYPPFTHIVDGLANLVKRHPQTTFIGAHVGCYAENLTWVGALLDRCPNFYVDISARMGELGRQPYSARKFFITHAERILFGSDFGPDIAEYRLAYRFLETEDEYFNYNAAEYPKQGRWYAYGLNLPDDVLEKVYHKNAERVLHPGAG